MQTDEIIGEEQKLIFSEIAVGSALLLWINVIFIYVTAVLVFKIKKVGEFQLIRRIDEEAWRNLPRVQRSPTARGQRDREGRQRLASSSSIGSEITDDDTLSLPQSDYEDEGERHPQLSPIRRRQPPRYRDDESQQHLDAV